MAASRLVVAGKDAVGADAQARRYERRLTYAIERSRTDHVATIKETDRPRRGAGAGRDGGDRCGERDGLPEHGGIGV